MSLTLEQIQQKVGGEIIGDGSIVIEGLADLRKASPKRLSFLDSPKYAQYMNSAQAGAVVVSKKVGAVAGKTVLVVDNPRVTFMHVLELFAKPRSVPKGVHSTAVIDPSANIGEGVSIGEHAVVRAGASVGANTVLDSGVHIGARAVVGEDTYLGPNVIIMDDCRIGSRVVMHGGVVIGGDGFGFVRVEGGRSVKVPQIGNVIIEDDVEIGANTCVDRGTMESTIVKRGAKIDNQVQIAHNDVIGEDALIAGQVGLAGSVTIGKRAMMGGKSGVVDHLTVGDDAMVGAATIVTKNIPDKAHHWGYPSHEAGAARRIFASLSRLPELLKAFRRLVKRVEALEAKEK